MVAFGGFGHRVPEPVKDPVVPLHSKLGDRRSDTRGDGMFPATTRHMARARGEVYQSMSTYLSTYLSTARCAGVIYRHDPTNRPQNASADLGAKKLKFFGLGSEISFSKSDKLFSLHRDLS